MQSRNYDGALGPLEPYDSKKLENLLEDENVESVKVFKLPKNITITEMRRLQRIQKIKDNAKKER